LRWVATVGRSFSPSLVEIHLGVTESRIFCLYLGDRARISSVNSVIKSAFINHEYTFSATQEFWIGVIILYAGSLFLVAFSLSTGAAKFLVDGGVYWASGILANG
jgi:hypothetical protein